ncbi:LOW QUALITY PROTEIN: olfactory receptor 1P1-like [Sciurus carolinensis]|uniref:LOW QUALITY PROTEIN: olfactory receptor 1P1-like n=1 Tax=Sciurus carolinensis TaxID=30640 RepID=UPI001FB1A922|nr:LOW QUALITY PROTEIN: olfactory receptor 1P1-like [Sciurus carolinensis]
MAGGNQTNSSEFLLWGLSEWPEQKHILFLIFLCLYVITVAGKLLVVLAIGADTQIHTPVYFFLTSLSCADILFTSITVPKALLNIHTKRKSISYAGCLAQLYFFLALRDMDIFLLATVAYGHFIVICHPLPYAVIMNFQHCTFIMIACWTFTSYVAMTHTFLIFWLSFCSKKTIPDFLHDLGHLIKISCSDIQVNKLVLLFLWGTVILIPFLLIQVSYIQIVSAILRFPSAQGRLKAFSACGSHLSVVALFFGTVIRAYLCPSSSSSNPLVEDTAAVITYTVVTSMLNPFSYSLRNKNMKAALVRLLRVKVSFLRGQ